MPQCEKISSSSVNIQNICKQKQNPTGANVMSGLVIKAAANSVTIGTTNTAIGYSFVRLVNTDATNVALITVFDVVADAQVSTVHMLANSELVIEKARSDVLTANLSNKVFGVGCARY
jgi:transcription elongation factor